MDGIRFKDSSLITFQEPEVPDPPKEAALFDLNAITPTMAMDILDRVVALLGAKSRLNQTSVSPESSPGLSTDPEPVIDSDPRINSDLKHEREEAMGHPKKHQRSQSKNSLSGVYHETEDPNASDSSSSLVTVALPSKAAQNRTLLKRFQLKAPPPLSIIDYLHRINDYCPLSTSVCLAASFYLCALAPQNVITEKSEHRFVLAAIRLAMKSIEDMCHKHKFFSQVGGVGAKEMFRLEVGLLFLLEFNVVITEDKLQAHLRDIQPIVGDDLLPKALSGSQPPDHSHSNETLNHQESAPSHESSPSQENVESSKPEEHAPPACL